MHWLSPCGWRCGPEIHNTTVKENIMSDEVKQIIKSVNDGDMVATRDAFNQAVAQKIYDNIESKKEEIATTIFNKTENEQE